MHQTAAPPEVTMLQMLTGYWACQALATAARLGVMDALPGTASEIAARLSLNEDALLRLLRGCAGLEALRTDDGQRFEVTELGEFLTGKHPRSMAGLAVMMTDPGHWNSWGQLAHCVRTGQTGVMGGVGSPEIFDYFRQNPEESHNFNQAMASMTHAWAEHLEDSYDFSPFATICDVGGNHGIVLSAALRANPNARGILLDLPHVLAEAPEIERAEKVAGDFFQSVPPADCYLLKHILHDWNDEQCLAILRTIVAAMPPNGRVLVLEMLLGDEPGFPDLMDLNMLVMTGGRERTAEQFARLFSQAGLKLKRAIFTPAFYCILEATRP